METGITKLWVDESGDCGFKFDKGSTRFFVIAGVFIAEDDELGGVCSAIGDLRTELNR